ncbi:MAG: BtpA/SgcQ family protein [Myxococcota bacterium]
MALFRRQRPDRPLLIGVVHVLPLPGSPRWGGDIERLRTQAMQDAWAYYQGGADALIVENMHDLPYLRGHVYPETTAAMTVVARAVKEVVPELPVGVQLLAGANREALGVAIAARLDFLRVEAFAYAHIADEGLLQASAGELLRLRATLQAEHVEVLADIHKKHSSHAITRDLSLEALAEGTTFCEADGLIVTGLATGHAPQASDVARVKRASPLPVLVGSGITPENVHSYAEADGLIVGSSVKVDGNWRNPVDAERVAQLRRALRG